MRVAPGLGVDRKRPLRRQPGIHIGEVACRVVGIVRPDLVRSVRRLGDVGDAVHRVVGLLDRAPGGHGAVVRLRRLLGAEDVAVCVIGIDGDGIRRIAERRGDGQKSAREIVGIRRDIALAIALGGLSAERIIGEAARVAERVGLGQHIAAEVIGVCGKRRCAAEAADDVAHIVIGIRGDDAGDGGSDGIAVFVGIGDRGLIGCVRVAVQRLCDNGIPAGSGIVIGAGLPRDERIVRIEHGFFQDSAARVIGIVGRAPCGGVARGLGGQSAVLVIERLGEPFTGRILRADLSACGVIDVYNGFSARRGDRRAVVCDVIGIRRDAAIRRSDCGDATAHIVGIRRGIAARVGLRRQPAHAVIGIGGGERRPAVRGDGDRPQIRAVIIIHALRGIVKSNIRISALFRQSALFVIGIRRPRRENAKEPCFRTVLLRLKSS